MPPWDWGGAMVEVLVPRALHAVSVEEVNGAEGTGRARTLFTSGTEATRVELRVLRIQAGLVVEEGFVARLVEEGETLELGVRGRRLCRYHEGPRGDPLHQKWCHAPATRGSWCQRHSTSILALYEKCTAGRDWDACRAVDAVWRDEEYIVYLVWHGAGFKVGVTRAWRLYTRLLEQPHIAAAIIAKTRSITEARRIETKLGKMKGVNEGIGVPRARRMQASLLSTLPLTRVAEKIASMLAALGFTGRYEAVSIENRCPHAPLLSPTRSPPSGKHEFICTWGGVVVLRSQDGKLYGVTRDSLLHYEYRWQG